jgi:hypothetical protein
MLKLALAGLLMLAVAMPAGATVYTNHSGSPGNDVITVTLVIGCYTNVYWNDVADENIVFNNATGSGGDWYNTTLTGAYGTNTKASQDAYATDYYESYDAAFFWLQSNCDVTMTVTPNGDLTHTDMTSTLDTWYTVAFTNNTNCTPGTDCGFINGGVRVSDGNIPTDGQGFYANDSDNNDVWELGGSGFYPNQHCFPMVDNPQTASFTAFTEGTILFHARVLRNGISDKAGTYTTTIGMTFAEATP